MLNVLNGLKKLILLITNNANYSNFLGTIIVAFTSYKVASYNASKPNKIKVKQLQLSNVYLPLFRLLENATDNLSLQKAIYIHKKITNILDANYELAFPQLHQLNKSFGSAIRDGSDYQKYFHRMKHIVATDYELLKKALGYPSENFVTIFIRMTFKQKMLSIISWINILWVLGPTIYFVVFSFNDPTFAYHHLVLTIFIAIVTLFPLIKINHWINNLKD